MFCFATFVVGLFKISSQKLDIGSALYMLSGVLYFLSWRGLSYYYCLVNQVVNVSIILGLLQEVRLRLWKMAKLLENGLYHTYFSSGGFYKMGCLIFSIISIYFNFFAYRIFKHLALEIFEYEQKHAEIE